MALHNYLEKSNTPLKGITIEHIDAFLAEFNAALARSTQRFYRSYLRHFLTYLVSIRGYNYLF